MLGHVIVNQLSRINFWPRKFYGRILQVSGSRFYVNPDLDLNKSILMAGTARSGTVWLAHIIASQVPSISLAKLALTYSARLYFSELLVNRYRR